MDEGKIAEAVTVINPGKWIFLGGIGPEQEGDGTILHKGDFQAQCVYAWQKNQETARRARRDSQRHRQDNDLRDGLIEHVLKINAGSYSFECANPRHEHEYHLFESIKIPEDKVLCPGMITHASNIVEHPELIAERILRFADLVGRENVMAGGDCGFSSQLCTRLVV
jgi:methionine synthase II (cobalamin-independent)